MGTAATQQIPAEAVIKAILEAQAETAASGSQTAQRLHAPNSIPWSRSEPLRSADKSDIVEDAFYSFAIDDGMEALGDNPAVQVASTLATLPGTDTDGDVSQTECESDFDDGDSEASFDESYIDDPVERSVDRNKDYPGCGKRATFSSLNSIILLHCVGNAFVCCDIFQVPSHRHFGERGLQESCRTRCQNGTIKIILVMTWVQACQCLRILLFKQ